MKKLFVIGLALGAAILFQQCGKDDHPTPAKKTEGVYMGGRLYTNDGTEMASYTWNGVMHTLEDGSVDSYIEDLTVSGNDVYMAGSKEDQAVYWKNGTLITLPLIPNTSDNFGQGIAIKNNNVHVVGGAGTQVAYWKNGVANSWGYGLVAGNGDNIAVTEANDVYVVGSKNGGTYQAGYWKNGVWTLLSDPQNSAFGTGIEVVSSDVYVSGRVNSLPCYWKNGELFELGSNSGFTSEIKVINGDVYVAGGVSVDGNNIAVYWKNGVEARIETADPAYAYNIEVKNNDIYLSGEIYANGWKTVLWKNGELVAPHDGTQSENWGSFYTLYVR